jgi:uncharacterized membrane protein
MAVVLLLALMIAIAAMRVFVPMGAKIEGKPVGVITLSFRERMLLQRTNLYLIGAVILLGALSGFLTGPLEMVALLATFAVLTIPARYRFTSQGIALNNVVFRSWTDFRGYREERGSIVLDAVEGQRKFRMPVVGANRDAAVKALSRIMARSAAEQKSGGARAGGRVRP